SIYWTKATLDPHRVKQTTLFSLLSYINSHYIFNIFYRNLMTIDKLPYIELSGRELKQGPPPNP
ncbi:hypothetical protein LINGRAHAP2_LOCUS24291, partial [Linum grandiflorum]